MSEQKNVNLTKKCPYCSCLFFTDADFYSHMGKFGIDPEKHLEEYRKLHAIVEHGSFNDDY